MYQSSATYSTLLSLLWLQPLILVAVGQDVGRGLACTIYHSTVPPSTSPASRCYHARLRLFGCQHPKFRAKPSEK